MSTNVTMSINKSTQVVDMSFSFSRAVQRKVTLSNAVHLLNVKYAIPGRSGFWLGRHIIGRFHHGLGYTDLDLTGFDKSLKH